MRVAMIPILTLGLSGGLPALALDTAPRDFQHRMAAQVEYPATARPAPGDRRPQRPCWYLWLQPADERALTTQGQDWLLRLRVEGQVATFALPPRAARELVPGPGWSRHPRWMLVSERGEEVGQGSTLPSGETVLPLFRAKGNLPAWEQRSAFLAEHPNLGTAWMEDLERNAWLTQMRLKTLQALGEVATQAPGPSDLRPFYAFTAQDPGIREGLADRVFGDLANDLEGLMKVPGWQENLGRTPWPPLSFLGAGESPRVRSLARSALGDLEGALRRDPELKLGRFWAEFTFLARGDAGRMPVGVLPAPDSVWPDRGMVVACLSGFLAREDWKGALDFLNQVARLMAAQPESPGARSLRALALAGQALPLLRLGRIPEAAAALEESRGCALAGEDLDLGSLGLDADDPALPREIQTALGKAPTGDAPSPRPVQPARLTLLGRPAWQEDWDKLIHADALLSWGPGELVRETLPPEEEAALRTGQPWGPEPRWVLRRDASILATGLPCPSPEGVALLLSRGEPPRLARLKILLEEQPSHGPARRQRMNVLKARMPEPRLEALLAEDARATLGCSGASGSPTLDFGPRAPWKPDPALWQWSAQLVLPRLEGLLRCWPDNPAYWQAWTAWSRFLPGRPSPLALARTLEWPRPLAPGMGSLPAALHLAVVETLKRDGDPADIAAWLQEAWEAQVPPASGPWTPPACPLSPEDLGRVIVKPLTEALAALGRGREATAILRTYQQLRGAPEGE